MSTWPIGLTIITLQSEHAGLQTDWKRVETELYKLADRCKENPRALSQRLKQLAVKINQL